MYTVMNLHFCACIMAACMVLLRPLPVFTSVHVFDGVSVMIVGDVFLLMFLHTLEGLPCPRTFHFYLAFWHCPAPNGVCLGMR